MTNETHAHQPRPNPRKLLNKPDYFVAPVATIIAPPDSSPTDGSSSAIIDAYSLFITRIKDVATVLACNTNSTQCFPALESLRPHAHTLSDHVLSHVGLAFRRASYPLPNNQEERPQYHSAVKRHPQDSRTASSTCHHAIQLLSSLFAFETMSRLFSDEDLGALLDRLLDVLEATHLRAGAKKTKSLAMFALTIQQLPVPVVLPRASRLVSILQGIIKDKGADRLLLGDSFKVLHNLLVRHPGQFLQTTHELFPYILQKFHSSDRVLRLRAAYAIAGFARASVWSQSDMPETFADQQRNGVARKYLADTVYRFAVQNHSPPPPQPGKTYRLMFWSRIRSALPAIAEDAPGEDASWAFSVLGSLVVLLDGQIFTTMELLRPILEVLSKTLLHPSAALAGLRTFLWKALHWSFTRIHSLEDRVRPSKGPDLTPHENLRTKFYTVLRNGTGPGVRAAFVYALLGPDEAHASRESPARSNFDKDIHNALLLVQDLVSGPSKADYAEGVSLLTRLTAGVGNSSAAATSRTWDTSFILSVQFLNGSFIEMPPVVLGGMQSEFDDFDVDSVRPLSDSEVGKHWTTILLIWEKAVKRTLILGDLLPVDLLDVWRALLLSKAILTASYAHLDAPAEVTQTILSLLLKFLHWKPPADTQPSTPEPLSRLQALRLRTILALWRVVTLVYSPTWLRQHSTAVLNYVLTAEKDFDSLEVKAAWENLCVFIILHGKPGILALPEPQLKLDLSSRRTLWTKAAAAWQFFERPGYSWQDICAFMTIPPQLWDMDSKEELEAWSWLLDCAVMTARKTMVSSDTVLETLALELIVKSSASSTLFPKIFTLFIPYLSLAKARKIPVTVLEEIGDSLASYDRGEFENTLRMFLFFTEQVKACPPSSLVPFLTPLSNGLAVWIRDLDRVVPDAQHDSIIVTFYIQVAERLASILSTAETLAALEDLIGAPIVDDFRSPRAGAAFQRFCEHICAVHARPAAVLPLSIQRRLGAWYDALDIKERPSFIGNETQTQAFTQFVHEESLQVVPDSQPLEDGVVESSVLMEHSLASEALVGVITARQSETEQNRSVLGKREPADRVFNEQAFKRTRFSLPAVSVSQVSSETSSWTRMRSRRVFDGIELPTFRELQRSRSASYSAPLPSPLSSPGGGIEGTAKLEYLVPGSQIIPDSQDRP